MPIIDYPIDDEKTLQIFRDGQNIFFDLDGTLIDSSRGIYNSYLYAYKKSDINVELIEYDIFKNQIGPPFEIMNKNLHPELSSKENNLVIKYFRKKYDEEYYLNYRVYKDIRDCLINLKELNYFLFILTNKKKLQLKI